ncbi:MAG: class I SAM-dependent methyltransferase [Halodesulfurarchaeum sp.]|nr:class I SAM-dependent methyltransferase [Halodesulfurarchaeum sp.]
MDSQDVRQEWASRSGEYSPEYYAHYGADAASEAVRKAIEDYLGPDPAILEIGCSSGRNLAALLEAGYTDLTGVELNDAAEDVMETNFPALAKTATVHYRSIESVLREFEKDQFDVVFSVETLQHIHPDSEWVFDELSRITRDLLLTVENEGQEGPNGDSANVNYVDTDVPLYYRDWKRIFTNRGFEAVAVESAPRDTIRTFRLRDR